MKPCDLGSRIELEEHVLFDTINLMGTLSDIRQRTMGDELISAQKMK